MVQLEIDGVSCLVPEHCNIIEAARLYNILIPRFCYHKKLSVAANCRMCLVELYNLPKLVPACTLRVTDGMKVYTTSPAVLKAQRDVMEFLLINHPLDCPICDQGGECELQDISVKHGRYRSSFSEKKRVIKNENFGPLIETVFNRCILCTRCIRFGIEVAGVQEIGVVGRGVYSRVSTFVSHTVKSVLSGNIIDLCPVGALTSKLFKFKVRAWELVQYPNISPHDCIGSNLFLHVKDDTIFRVVSRENDKINEVWISDRDRFSYEGMYSSDRLQVPLIKKFGNWQEVSWQEVFSFVFGILNKYIKTKTVEQVGVIISPNSTNEEFYLCQKLFRSFGVQNIDCYLKHNGTSESFIYKKYPILNFSLDALTLGNVGVLLIGASIFNEQPILVSRLNKLVRNGGNICSLNSRNYKFPFFVKSNLVISHADYVTSLAKIVKAILMVKNIEFFDSKLFETVVPGIEEISTVKILLSAEKKEIILGEALIAHKNFSQAYYLCNIIAKLLDTGVSVLTSGSNTVGGWLNGCVPNKLPGMYYGTMGNLHGISAFEMFKKCLGCYVLINVEPNMDFLYKNLVQFSLENAESVVCITPFRNSFLDRVASVLIPTTFLYEMDGTYVNALGMWQSVSKVVSAPKQLKQTWKILNVLGKIFSVPGFTYKSIEDVSVECRKILIKLNDFSEELFLLDCNAFSSSADDFEENVYLMSLYQSDALVRHANSLQSVSID